MKRVLFLSLMLVAFKSEAQYTPGNLVVLKVGNGATALSAKATNVTLVQLKTDGTRIDSASIPSTGSNKLVLVGNNYLDGALRLSSDGQYITFAGYDAAVGDTSFTTFNNTNKVIARVDANRVIDLSTKIVQSDTVRIGSAITDDGTRFWFSLSKYNGTSTYSISYAPFGTVSVPTAVSDSKTNWRSVNIFGGQLMANVSNQVLSIGTTLADVTLPASPITASTLFTNNTSPSPAFNGYGFVMFDLDANEPGYDVAYVLSQGSNTTRGIVKSIKTNGVWNSGAALTNTDVRAVAGAPATNPGGLIDITGTIVSGKPVIYATRGTGANNSILSISDAGGYSATFTPTYATIANAGGNFSFIGISFTPGTMPYLSLPLNLLSFNGVLKSESVFLKWTTNNEINTQSFTVEKSKDAVNYTSIGVVPSKNLPSTNYYEYTDKTVNGTVFYRLKMTDKDGSITYSSVISINNSLLSSKLVAYPNPFKENLTINHTKSSANDFIRILNIDGRIINSYRVEPDAKQTTINVSELIRSQYLLQYVGKQGTSTILINKK